MRLTSGQIGGEGRVTLTADATLPCDGKPIVCFGDADLGVGRWRHRPRRHRRDRRQPGFVHADRCRPARQPGRAQRGRDHGVAGDGVDDRPACRARRRHPRPLGRDGAVGHRERAVMCDDQRHRRSWPTASTTFPADLLDDAIHGVHRHRRTQRREDDPRQVPVDRQAGEADRAARRFGVGGDGRCPVRVLGVERDRHRRPRDPPEEEAAAQGQRNSRCPARWAAARPPGVRPGDASRHGRFAASGRRRSTRPTRRSATLVRRALEKAVA